MSDIKTSQEKALEELLKRFKDLTHQIDIGTNFKNTLKRQIIGYFELLDIDKKDNVKRVEKINVKKVSIRQLKKLFNLPTSDNGDDIFEHIMVEVDIDKTVENLIYLKGMNETMAKKIGERLNDLHETKYIELEIGK
jgi:hypothetical protein